MKLTPTSIAKYEIYDVLYNDMNQIVIIATFTKDSIPFTIKLNDELFKRQICGKKHGCVFTLFQSEYKETINLTIEDIVYENIKVNRYPIFENKLIMSAMVYNEDNYIVQWIEYYLLLGISHFVIYDNALSIEKTSYKSIEITSDLPTLLDKYIKNNIVTLIEWPYKKRLCHNADATGQIAQQNHSIYTFRTSKYIGLFDIDEYVNIPSEMNIDLYIDKMIQQKKINIDRYSAINIRCKLFYNPDRLPTDGYKFLKIYNCDKVTTFGREKSFVMPKNDITHYIHNVTSGKPMYIADNIFHFNHYYYLNKEKRGIVNTDLSDNSIHRISQLLDNLI
jgi:hypothetical protein